MLLVVKTKDGGKKKFGNVISFSMAEKTGEYTVHYVPKKSTFTDTLRFDDVIAFEISLFDAESSEDPNVDKDGCA